MDNPPKDWGMQWQPFIRYTGEYNCLNCGLEFMEQFDENGDRVSFYENIVGFSRSCPEPSDRPVIGMFIVDCPKCQSKFWFHAHDEANIWLAREYCPNWPKDDQSV